MEDLGAAAATAFELEDEVTEGEGALSAGTLEDVDRVLEVFGIEDIGTSGRNGEARDLGRSCCVDGSSVGFAYRHPPDVEICRDGLPEPRSNCVV